VNACSVAVEAERSDSLYVHRGAMTFGHRMLVLLRVDDPNLEIPFRESAAGWNPRESLDSKRIMLD
jgi:hypothetical protein